MTGSRETEFKFLLSSPEHEKVLAHLGRPERERVFLNRYYTVEGGSDRRDWVLRLRVEGERKELTLKLGREVRPGLFDSMEHTEEVVNECPKSWEGSVPLVALRREVSGAALREQGEMRNRRRVYPPPIAVGRWWELDTAELPGGRTFHELEVEVEADSEEELRRMRQRLVDWLEQRGVEAEPGQKTKYARFLESLTP